MVIYGKCFSDEEALFVMRVMEKLSKGKPSVTTTKARHMYQKIKEAQADFSQNGYKFRDIDTPKVPWNREMED